MADETLRRTAEASDEQAGEAPKKRAPRRKKADAPDAGAPAVETAAPTEAAPRKKAPARKKADAPAAEAPAEAPKPRGRRKKADEALAETPPTARPTEGPPLEQAAPARRRRTTRSAEPVASSDAVFEAPARDDGDDRPEARPEPPREERPARGARKQNRVIDLSSPRGAEGSAEGRAPEGRMPEGRAPENRAPEGWGENWGGENRGPENRGPENRGPENRGPENREYREYRDAPGEGGEGGRRRNKRNRRKKDKNQGGPQQGGYQGNPQGPRPQQAPQGGGQGDRYGGGPDRYNGGGDRYNGGYQGGPQGGNGGAPQAVDEPFEGMLELIGDKKFGFIRKMSTSLMKGDNDPFMPPPLIQKFNLRDGVFLKGAIRPGRKGAWQVVRVDEVMGMSPEEWKETTDFDEGMVIYPDEKLNLIAGPSDVSMRVIDLVAPIGKGQRSLIVAPPRAGKTVILKKIAEGLAQNHPEVELIALLIDERPEEVTDFRRNTTAKVFASSNDFGEDNHIRVATLAFEYARRFVEMGKDVVILLDSLTRLGRTFNLWGGNSGRTMSGGLDARALLIPRKIFGAARNIEGGGSLTIIATALVETGSRMDDVIFEEFKGTGNAEIVLDRELADKRIYPAINIRKSGTRNEERLMPEEQIRQRHMLFRVLNARHPVEAMQALVKQIQLSPTNVHLLNELIPEQY